MLDINKHTQHTVEAAEMFFLRRTMRVSWTEKKTNNEILRITNCNGNMIINN